MTPPEMATATRRTQKERREKTRRKLLDAAVAVLAEVGYARCTFALVAKEAGLTTGALQYHFGTKTNLLQAVLMEHLFPIMQMDLPQSQAGKPLKVRCKVMVEWGWKIYGDPDYPVVWDIILGAREDPVLREQVVNYQRKLVKAALRFTEILFEDLSISRAQLRELSIFYSAQLRGLALLRPFHYDERFFRRQLRLLCETLEQHVKSKFLA